MSDRRERVPNHGHFSSSSEQLSSQPSFHADTHIPCGRDRGEPHTHRVRTEPAPDNLTSLRQYKSSTVGEGDGFIIRSEAETGQELGLTCQFPWSI